MSDESVKEAIRKLHAALEVTYHLSPAMRRVVRELANEGMGDVDRWANRLVRRERTVDALHRRGLVEIGGLTKVRLTELGLEVVGILRGLDS